LFAPQGKKRGNSSAVPGIFNAAERKRCRSSAAPERINGYLDDFWGIF
jgi:hypothetical protein